jgi:hypothetical protein
MPTIDRIIRPSDGTPAGAALDLHNTLATHARGASVTTRVYFGPFPPELDILGEDGTPQRDPDDIFVLEGAQPASAPALARALAAELARELSTIDLDDDTVSS